MLDRLFTSTIPWDAFYADRGKSIPFLVPEPDENLASYLARGLLPPGRAQELGCGPGRNAIHLASFGFEVDAVDLSPAGASSSAAWPTRRRICAGSSLTWPKSRCGMAEQPQDSALFGVPFLLTALFRRPAQITTR